MFCIQEMFNFYLASPISFCFSLSADGKTWFFCRPLNQEGLVSWIFAGMLGERLSDFRNGNPDFVGYLENLNMSHIPKIS